MTYDIYKEHVEKFLLYLQAERNVTRNTYRAYMSDLNQLLTFWRDHYKSNEPSLSLRTIIERYLVTLFYKKMNKQTIARKCSCFTSFETFLKASGIETHLSLARPRVDKKLPMYLSMEEITHLLDNISNEELQSPFPLRDKAILELLYATGVRCSELITIRFCDIDMHEKVIRIYGKGRKERLVLFGQKAHEKIVAYLAHERARYQRHDEPLFLNYRHEPLTTRSVQRIIHSFRRFLKTNRPITPHKIRHTFATHLIKQGADLRTVQELLGHQTLASTEKYTHVSLEELIKTCETKHPINTLLPSNKHHDHD
ncbi:MAG TPA: site-specific tyrosine recombinase/integron integrase [Candidatus Bathyarchaeia archaeon]|nr:site-specific tyrosine recombinase/integron integrase [Candidatus Bathyarchaeia archaeon]